MQTAQGSSCPGPLTGIHPSHHDPGLGLGSGTGARLLHPGFSLEWGQGWAWVREEGASGCETSDDEACDFISSPKVVPH